MIKTLYRMRTEYYTTTELPRPVGLVNREKYTSNSLVEAAISALRRSVEPDVDIWGT